MRRAAERLGGTCTGACDSDARARRCYLATFPDEFETLHDLSEMGHHPSVARQSDIIFCGFCCKPFSPAGKTLGFDDERFGDNLELLAAALAERRTAGLMDPAIILENVPNLLRFLTAERLQSLGYHTMLFVVGGAHFRCASMRERIVIVGFLQRSHLVAFRPPPPQARTPTPLRSALKHFTVTAGDDLFLKPSELARAESRAHVVSRGWPMGARSPTSSYGNVSTPGTLVAVDPKLDGSDQPLTAGQVRLCSYGDVRKLHPDELLAAFSFKPHEMPRLTGGLAAQYEAVCQTVCVNVFEAVAAEVLAAIGKPQPREALYARLRAEGVCLDTTTPDRRRPYRHAGRPAIIISEHSRGGRRR